MNVISFFRHGLLGKVSVTCACILCVIVSGCYSFTGGAAPSHLKTTAIATVSDDSGFGNPQFREFLTEFLVQRFRNDNTLSVVTRGGDSRLSTAIVSIADATVNVRPGEVERERRATVTVRAEFYDNVKKKSVFSRDFSNAQIYAATEGQVGRNEAATRALSQIADDILLATVSGW